MPILVLLLAAMPAETIRYERGPCYGRCPAYVVTVTADRQGVFEGMSDTAVHGRRRFHVTRRQYAAFAARLRPVRPNGEVLIEPGQPLCHEAATDQIRVDVRWSGATGDPRHLSVYFGCDMGRHDAIQRALIAAPDALPIAALVSR